MQCCQRKLFEAAKKSVQDRNGSKTDGRLDDFGINFPEAKSYRTSIPGILPWGHDVHQNVHYHMGTGYRAPASQTTKPTVTLQKAEVRSLVN